MPQSFFQIGVHLVFSTKDRLRYLDCKVIGAMHSYLATLLRGHKCGRVVVGGTDDHIHVFCTLPKDITPIELIRITKQESSKWIKKGFQGYDEFAWQKGYGIFSVSPQYFDKVISYINNQEEHHEQLSFQDEFRMFLKKYDVEFNERYVWD